MRSLPQRYNVFCIRILSTDNEKLPVKIIILQYVRWSDALSFRHPYRARTGAQSSFGGFHERDYSVRFVNYQRHEEISAMVFAD